MTSHADTIRDLLMHYVPDGFRDEDGVFHDGPYLAKGLDALDALLVENQRLRDALERIIDYAAAEGANTQAVKNAREALAGDAE